MSGQSNKTEKTYLPASSVALQVGYTVDYVTRLARTGEVLAKKVGRQWHVEPESVRKFSEKAKSLSEKRTAKLRAIRKREYRARQQKLQEKKKSASTYSGITSGQAVASFLVDTDVFTPATAAAKSVGYTADYVTRLARTGAITAKKVGRQWHVNPDSLSAFAAHVRKVSEKRTEGLRAFRKVEYTVHKRNSDREIESVIAHGKLRALAGACMACVFVLLVSAGGYLGTHEDQRARVLSIRIDLSPAENLARSFYFLISPDARYAYEARMGSRDASQRTHSYDVSALSQGDTLEIVEGAFSDHVDASFDVETSNSGVITPQFKDGPGTDVRFRLFLEKQESRAQGG